MGHVEATAWRLQKVLPPRLHLALPTKSNDDLPSSDVQFIRLLLKYPQFTLGKNLEAIMWIPQLTSNCSESVKQGNVSVLCAHVAAFRTWPTVAAVANRRLIHQKFQKRLHEKLASRHPGALVHLSLKGHKTKATEKGNAAVDSWGGSETVKESELLTSHTFLPWSELKVLTCISLYI